MAPDVALAVTEYESRDFSLVDVNRAGCTKGTTLAEWAARQGLTRDEVMAVGDNFNDREMLEYAGVPVVMGNAVDELKGLGWPVTLDNDRRRAWRPPSTGSSSADGPVTNHRRRESPIVIDPAGGRSCRRLCVRSQAGIRRAAAARRSGLPS